MNIGVISVTKQGDEISKKLSESLEIKLFSKSFIKDFDLKAITKELMESCEAIIFISSTGIAVRAIAPYLKSKTEDPAVVVIDSSCKYVISLVSGHLGGANDLTLKLAEMLNAQPVITTATDNMGIIAPDLIAREHGLIIEDLKKAKQIAAKLVEGKRISFLDDRAIIALPQGYIEKSQDDCAQGQVYVTHKFDVELKNIDTLKLIRKDIILGIGCRRDFDQYKMREIVIDALKAYNIDLRAVKAISTVELKKNEKAIIELGKYLNCEINIFTIEQIKAVEHKYKASDFVRKSIGVAAVCEPCVELSEGRLLTQKMPFSGMTLCIGEEILHN